MHTDPSRFYDEAIAGYEKWSKHGNIHFGYCRWPNLHHVFFLEKMLGEMNRQVAQRLWVDKGEKVTVLDAGCGYGTTCMQMCRLLPHASITGVNISQKQIEQGRQNLQNEALQKRVSLIRADFREIPISDAHFDAAYAIESACYGTGTDKADFLREMARLLKPGGRLVVADGFRKRPGSLPRWLEKWHRKNLAYWSLAEMPEITKFIEKMEEIKLALVEVREISWQVAPSALHLLWLAGQLATRQVFQKKAATDFERTYPKAALLTFFLGLFRRHFGYYLVVAVRK